jgi:hypothetical protein
MPAKKIRPWHIRKKLALVCIASLLVPMHHKPEKWATRKLVEKNKQVRLAAAKKTIEELENDDL